MASKAKSVGGAGHGEKVCAPCSAGCGKPGALKCARCKRVSYCGTRCQKAHWKAGHRGECTPPPLPSLPDGSPVPPVPPVPLGPRATQTQPAGGGHCFICFDDEGVLVPGGCACRGEAALSHVACRVELAAHRGVGDCAAWWQCGTCKAAFHGTMRSELARELWSRVQVLPANDADYVAAQHTLAMALKHEGRLAEAFAVLQDLVGTLKAMDAETSNQALLSMSALAELCREMGSTGEAARLQAHVLRLQEQTLAAAGAGAGGGGGDKRDAALQFEALGSANNLALSLSARGQHQQAADIFRDIVPKLTRLQGADHLTTLMATAALANEIMELGQPAEGIKLHR